MGGVDFSADPSLIDPSRFAYIENMYRDWESGTGQGIETVPGYRRIATWAHAIRGLFPLRCGGEERLVVHAGPSLYSFPLAERDSLGTLAPIPRRLAGGEEAAPLADAVSQAFREAGRLYLLDGEHYAVTDGETLSYVRDEAYLPTVWLDGEPYEQKNLLTDRVREEYHLFEPEKFEYGTPTLRYAVLADGGCYVVGIDSFDATVVIPSHTVLYGREYPVRGIVEDAFLRNGHIKTLVVSEGVVSIGARAFLQASQLETVVLPKTLVRISAQSFMDCPRLQAVWLRETLTEVGTQAFYRCPSLTEVHFAGTAAQFTEITGWNELLDLGNPSDTVLYSETVYLPICCYFAMSEPAEELQRVEINGAPVSSSAEALLRYTVVRKENRPVGVVLWANTGLGIYGKTVSLIYRTSPPAADSGFAAGRPGYTEGPTAAIEGCRLCARFDGRIFLSGNPRLPGMVFYSQRNASGHNDPTYFGALNYFTDGDGQTDITALTANGDALLVFTEETSSGSAVFLHTAADGGSDLLPRIYPGREGPGGIGCVGGACTFLDDTVFLSPRGLEGVEISELGGERSILHRSSAVDRRLCAEELRRAVLCRFGSYLCVCVDGRIYLADGRQSCLREGHREYEWYFLNGIGVCTEQGYRYRLLSRLPAAMEGKTVTLDGVPHPFKTVTESVYADGETVYSAAVDESGTLAYYVLREGEPYLVDCDGERLGGPFSPATCFCQAGGMLFFGTEVGTLLLFNTDKREADGRIPRRYYTFDGRAYRSGCATKSDNVGLPHLEKATLRASGVLKLKAMSGARFTARVRTNREGWEDCDVLYSGRADYSENDFAAFSFLGEEEQICCLREGKRRWVEKQLYFVSEEYQRPFGIVNIAYRYRITGRIRT